jgi:hypothetical protein
MTQSILVQTQDGSLESSDGSVLYFSAARFREQICESGACFLCGCNAGAREFNDEHILPRWLLEKMDLFNTNLTLPNGTLIRYSQYTIPCCRMCNSRLGEEIEEPVSRILRGGIASVRKHLEEEGTSLLYSWLSLIYLKTHLKDRMLRQYRDRRLPADSISSVLEYDWGRFHHTYCVARARFFDVDVDPRAAGSFMVFQVKELKGFPRYDYRDFMMAQAALLRIGDVAFLAVFDDSGAALSDRYSYLSRITGPPSPIQLRELLAHLAYTNMAIADRPEFFTQVGPHGLSIRVRLPRQILREPFEEEALGRILFSCVEDYLPSVRAVNLDEIREQVKMARYTFLFDANGDFILESTVVETEPPAASLSR